MPKFCTVLPQCHKTYPVLHAHDAQNGGLTCQRKKLSVTKKVYSSSGCSKWMITFELGKNQNSQSHHHTLNEISKFGGSCTCQISLVRVVPTHSVLWNSWRVTEISQIILVLLDSRCPLLHYPPSLHDYLANHKVIFVLTKVDITGSACAEAWTHFLRAQYPETQIVRAESYIEKRGNAEQGHSRLEPHIPREFRDELVEAIKAAHEALLEPPANVRSNASRLQSWTAPVRRDINWKTLTCATTVQERPNAHAPPFMDKEAQENHDEKDDADDVECLTIGLIGP